MSFTVVLRKFNKRENSTKVPDSNEDNITLACNLKQSSGVISPVLCFKTTQDIYMYNYVSIGLYGRHYFIRDWTWNEGLWWATCEIDVLASWKSFIGASTQYILRSSHTYDGGIVDNLYPTTTGITTNTQLLENPWARSWNKGTYVLGIINSDSQGSGGVNYYYFTKSQLNKLNSALMESADWLNIDAGEISVELQKALINPFQYITSCIWFPFEFKGSGILVENLKFGWWEMNGVSCTQLLDYDYDKTYSITIPKHPQAVTRGSYLNLAPYSRYSLDFKPWGGLPIDTTFLDGKSTLYVSYHVDMITGKATLTISTDEQLNTVITRLDSMCAVPLQLSQMAVDYLGMASTAIGSATNTVQAITTGNVGGIISSVASGIESSIKSSQPQLQTSGSTGSTSDFSFKPRFQAQFFPLVAESLEHRGRPLCQEKVINTIPGFIMVADADVSLPGTAYENQMIKSYMEGGFYYE